MTTASDLVVQFMPTAFHWRAAFDRNAFGLVLPPAPAACLLTHVSTGSLTTRWLLHRRSLAALDGYPTVFPPAQTKLH